RGVELLRLRDDHRGEDLVHAREVVGDRSHRYPRRRGDIAEGEFRDAGVGALFLPGDVLPRRAHDLGAALLRGEAPAGHTEVLGMTSRNERSKSSPSAPSSAPSTSARARTVAV